MTRLMVRLISVVGIVLMLSACGGQKRKEGIGELQKLYSALHDMDIVTDAGVTRDEFSRRLTDSLLKMGDVSARKTSLLQNFRKKEQVTVMELIAHLSKGMEAYKLSKDYFGDDYEYSSEYYLKDDEYQQAKKSFPNLEELSSQDVHYSWDTPGTVRYLRSSMLKALWRVALEESSRSKTMLDKLSQS